MCSVSLFFVMAEMCSGVGSICFLVFHGVTPWVVVLVLLVVLGKQLIYFACFALSQV